MSTLNKDTWTYAHKYWGGMCFILGILLALLTVIAFIYYKGHSDLNVITNNLTFSQLAVFILTIIPTEIRLHKIFDKHGHRK